jgi:hypothetical protein
LCKNNTYRPLWKEFTDIFEGSVGVKFGLAAKAKFLGLKAEVGGGIGTSPIKLEGSKVKSVLERDIGFTMGLANYAIGLQYVKEIPIQSGKPVYDKANVSTTFGITRKQVSGETPWKISVGGTFVFVKGNVGLNLKEAYDFFYQIGYRSGAK